MAPSLASNGFLLTGTTPPCRHRNRWHRRPTIFADASGNDSIPFKFDLLQLPDVKSLLSSKNSSATGGILSLTRRKDPGTVFVAGATGQAGTRIVQTLLRQGFSVRAGVADLGAAQQLATIAGEYRIISAAESRRLNAVVSAFDDAKSIAKAIGNAGKVVVTVGPGENGPKSQVTTEDALEVVRAAQLANADHVAVVLNESGEVPSSTYNVLDGITSFFANIFSDSQSLTKAELLQKLAETNVGYTLINTKLTDDFSVESSYSVVVLPEGSAGDRDGDYNKVTRSQIASLVAQALSNTAVAENKVVEAFTNPSAPSKPIDEQFRAVPEDSRRKAYAESGAKAAATAQEEEKKVEEKEEAEEDATIAENIASLRKSLADGFDWLKSRAGENEGAKVEIATVRGQAKARSLPSLRAVVKKTSDSGQSVSKTKVKAAAAAAGSKKESNGVFGGWFKQETIFVDDD